MCTMYTITYTYRLSLNTLDTARFQVSHKLRGPLSRPDQEKNSYQTRNGASSICRRRLETPANPKTVHAHPSRFFHTVCTHAVAVNR